MKSKQIEELFTAKVTEFIANGYTINLSTMSGSQGEIGKVDLRKGNEVVRLVLVDDYDSRLDADTLVFTIGKVIMPRNKKTPFPSNEVIWYGELEVIQRIVWYRANRKSDFYVSFEEMQEIIAKQEKRWENREKPLKVCNPRRDEALTVVLRFIRKKPRCSRKKVSDIADVHRGYNKGKLCYIVYLKDGKIFMIR